jgi:hypothetical protein
VAEALDMREALSGKLFERGVKRVHLFERIAKEEAPHDGGALGCSLNQETLVHSPKRAPTMCPSCHTQ